MLGWGRDDENRKECRASVPCADGIPWLEILRGGCESSPDSLGHGRGYR